MGMEPRNSPPPRALPPKLSSVKHHLYLNFIGGRSNCLLYRFNLLDPPHFWSKSPAHGISHSDLGTDTVPVPRLLPHSTPGRSPR